MSTLLGGITCECGSRPTWRKSEGFEGPEWVGYCKACKMVVATVPIDTAAEAAERRQRQMDRQARSALVQPMPTRFESPVVGTSFVPLERLYAIGEAWAVLAVLSIACSRCDGVGRRDGAACGHCGGSGRVDALAVAVELRRNPDNAHDANAVEVHVPVLAQRGHGTLVGHLPRALAARLAPHLDAGEHWSAALVRVAISDAHPDRPSLAIDVWRDLTPAAG